MKQHKPRLFTRASVRRAAFLLAASVLPSAHAADVEEAQTAITGTENIDDLAISAAQNASASANNAEGGKTSATATGVDAQAGDDHVSGSVAVAAEAQASAALLAMPKPGEVDATATGINAGDGNDLVDGALDISATATASGAYGGALDWSIQNPTQPAEKKIEAGITTNATATGIDTGEGDDVAGNTATLAVTAGAASGGGSAPLSVDTNQSNEIKSVSEANATATAFDSGAGSDTLSNHGVVTNSATAISGALSVSVTAPKGGATDSKPGSTQIKTDASATANATATGIDADSSENEDVDEDTREYDTSGLRYTLDRSSTAVAGGDTVANHALLTNTASATAGAAGATVSDKVDGALAATATAEANATATGITTGGGNDGVTNDGLLISQAQATGGALSVAIDLGAPRADGPTPTPGDTPTPQEPSEDRENRVSSNTSATANATATGIDTESGASETLTRLAEISTSAIVLDEHQSTTAAAGDDIVDSQGELRVQADATVDSLNAAVTLSTGGSANADSQSTATASATGITSGAGNDQVSNAGEFTVEATSTARAATLALAAGSPDATAPPAGEPEPSHVSVSGNTSVAANATAMGIDAEGQALSTGSARHLQIDRDGLQASRSASQTGVAGDDTVSNTAQMSATTQARALAGTAAASLGVAGSVSADSNATANAASTLIHTGAGNDLVINRQLLAADADASAAAVSIGITASKPASGAEPDPVNVSVKAGSTATASSLGIDTEGTGHDQASGETLAITRAGLVAERTRTTTSQSGEDTVDNSGELRTHARATSDSVGVGASVGAAGSVSADGNASATATSTAIYTGGGGDEITNDALVQGTSQAETLAVALAVSVSQPAAGTPAEAEEADSAKTQASANAASHARAVGIDADGEGQDQESTDSLRIDGGGLHVQSHERSDSSGGDDHVINGAEINAAAESRATALAGSVGIQADGTTTASTRADAHASSGALLTGAGSDHVENQGSLISTADSTAGAVSLSFSMSNEAGSRARADASSRSDASALGISTAADALGRESDFDLRLNRAGIQIDYRNGTTADISTDQITNGGDVTANAAALAGSLSAAVAIDGAASSEANATAQSRATALNAGGGQDDIFNAGRLDAGATSTSYALSASIGTAGGEKTRTVDSATVNSTASAESFGIHADNGRNDLTQGAQSIDATGLRATLSHESTAASAADVIVNQGDVSSGAVAGSHAGSVAVAIDGIANAEVNSSANTRAIGIEAGGGNDRVTNQGIVTSSAYSVVEAVGVSVGTNRSPGGRARVETNAAASASSAGIRTDDARTHETIDTALDIDATGLNLTASSAGSAAAGDDTLENTGNVTATADANSVAAGAAIAIKGASSASSRSSASADATALDTGAGADDITNSAELSAETSARTVTVTASVSNEGRAVANSGVFSAGTEASARSTGIAAAGIAATESLELSSDIEFDGIGVQLAAEHTVDAIGADGIDRVDNSGGIFVRSDVNATEVTLGITTKGTALTIGRTTAESSATGIDTGNLGDSIDNSGVVWSIATVDAVAVKAAVTGQGLAVAANSVWDGGTEVRATARGLDADGGTLTTRNLDADVGADLARVRYDRETTAASGDDTLHNSGDMLVVADSEVFTASVSAAAGSGAGLALTVSTSTADSDAIAVRGGDGSDAIQNSGALATLAEATAATVNVALSNSGMAGAADAVWDGGTRANASAIGIAGDGGERSHTRQVSVGTDGLSYDDEGVLADGADTIENTGDVYAEATSLAASVAVAMSAKGVGVATATSTSTANASAIDAGQGNAIDNVTNAGSLTAVADATAVTASVSVVNEGVAVAAGSVWDGGTHATSRARGVDVGSGGESIANSGDIAADAASTTVEVSASVAVTGVAVATATGTGSADSSAIDASAGNDADVVTNSGALRATASSTAVTAAVTFTNEGAAAALDAVWDGGTHSTARARGIEVGAAADVIHNTSAVYTDGDALGVSASAAIAVNGVAGAVSTATALSDVAALDAGADDARDVVTNSGRLTADSHSQGIAVSLSLNMNGAAVAAGGSTWDGGVSSTANATGVILGAGDDSVIDSGGTVAIANSESLGVSAALSMNGLAAALSAAQSQAHARGIDAGAGADSILTSAAAGMSASATSNATAVSVALTQNGVSVAGNNTWDGGTQSRADARVLDAGAGVDEVTNTSTLDAQAHANSIAASVALNVAGVAIANSTATATADAAAIDGGDDTDDIDNRAAIVADSVADAIGVNVSISGGGVALAADAVWDGGTTAEALSHGIRGGAGNDTLDNLSTSGAIHSTASATTHSVAVSISGAGFAGSTSTSTANAESAAIDGGTGDDLINNVATVSGSSLASATSVAVSVTTTGAAVATDAFWDGGTHATAVSSGLSGGAGNDTITNTGAASADSESTTLSVAASLAFSPNFAFSFAAAASTSMSDAAALNAGAGDDRVSNAGALTAHGDAIADGLSVAFSTSGAALTGGFDASTNAISSVVGISGGEGMDSLTNQGADITLDGYSQTRQLAVSLNLSGVNSADADTLSVSRGAGLDGGAGDDTLLNAGNIQGRVDAVASSLGVSAMVVGGNAASATARSRAEGAAMAGGSGDDQLANGGTVDLTFNAEATSQSINASVAGLRLSDASAEAATDSAGQRGDDGADVISNTGHITVRSTATTHAHGISAGGVGVSLASANSIANLQSAGLSGGEGDDSMVNAVDASVDVIDESYVNADSLSITISGGAGSEARALAHSSSAGLSGGTGNDAIVNAGTVRVTVNNHASADSASIDVNGAADARAGVEVDTNARGIDGGDGDDVVVNLGTLVVGPGTTPDAVMAYLSSTPDSVSIFGTANAQAVTAARTTSTGLDGGDGNDALRNEGTLSVTANARTNSETGSLNIFGGSGGSGQSGAFTHAAGLAGGAGDDTLLTLGALDVHAASYLAQDSSTFTFGGDTAASGELVAETRASGLSGGDGADTVSARGTVVVTALSELRSIGDSTAGFGSSGTVGQIGANTYVIGLDGGTGDDVIASAADITLNATSSLYMDSSSYTFGGNASNGAALAAQTEAHGVAGGDGADRIANVGALTINALATLQSEGSSETTFGGGSDFVTSGGVARATGLTGGTGDDTLQNSAGASLHVNANAHVTTRSTAYTFVGSAPSSGASLTGETDAAGLSGDAGNDSLINHGTLDVHAQASLESGSSASTTATGTSDTVSTGLSVVDVRGKGLSGGDGDDLLGGTGDITVLAEGLASSYNDTSSDFSIVNDNTAGAVSRSTVTAVGLDGGSGANRSEILGGLNVTARSTSYALSTSAGADVSWDSSGKSSVDANARAHATAVTGGAGADVVLANAPIDVAAFATTVKPLVITLNLPQDIRSNEFGEVLEAPPVLSAVPAANAAGYAISDVIFWHTLDSSYQDPHLPPGVQDAARGGYWQLQNLPDPNDSSHTLTQWVFLSAGLVQVRPVNINVGAFPSYAAADGGGITGSGNAWSTGTTFAEATGFSLGAGENTLDVQGSVDITARAEGVAFASADGDGWGNAYAFPTATASARAIGAETGDGNDRIRFLDDVHILAQPVGQTRGEASGGDVCIWFFGWWCGGGGSGYAYATVNVSSEAGGIEAGGGNNVIEIGRTIEDEFTVVSRPEIRVDGSAGEFVTQLSQIDGGNVTVSVTSTARGIDTGAGDDDITNRGVIKVEAYDLGAACNANTCAGLPPIGSEDHFASLVFASGITTGDGHDTLRNYGSISAETINTALSSAGRLTSRVAATAVDLGNGDDTLVLGDGSQIIGDVYLGAGDDRLELYGAPQLNRNSAGGTLQVQGGAGMDTLILHGAGSYAGSPASIERAIKQDAGTYTLASLDSNLQSIAVQAGTLRVNGNYAFSAAGEYSTFFNIADGSSGVFSFSGNTTLGGGVDIERQGDGFVANGRRWNVVHADGTVNGDFGDITLPAARPLLRFELERGAHDVDVVAVAPSFTTVTGNPLLQQVAANLDGVTVRSQDFVNLFGRLQNMDGGFDRAFKNFSPEAHLAASGSALTYSRELNQALRLHLGETRTRYRLGVDSAVPEVAFSLAGGNGGIGTLQLGGAPVYAMNEMPQPASAAPARQQSRGQTWMLGISARTDYDAREGFDAFESSTHGFVIGTDRRIGDEWLVGASIGAGESEVDVTDLANGGIDSWQASLYATWFSDRWHVEGGASRGKQEFSSHRQLLLDGEIGSVSSAHSGNVWSAFLGGGTRLGDDRLMIEPYFSLNYFDSREERFRESAASGISQIVDGGVNAALYGEAGFKFSALQKTAHSLIDWHFNLGLSHDFGIDDADVRFSYTGAMGSWFTLDARSSDANSHLFGAGVTLMKRDSAFTLEYRGLLNDDHEEQYLGARVSLRF